MKEFNGIQIFTGSALHTDIPTLSATLNLGLKLSALLDLQNILYAKIPRAGCLVGQDWYFKMLYI